jgi:hypothetical protein
MAGSSKAELLLALTAMFAAMVGLVGQVASRGDAWCRTRIRLATK